MDIRDYRKLPEGLCRDDVKKYSELVLSESVNEQMKDTQEKLIEMANRQWNVYEMPDKDLQEKVTNWINDHWNPSDQDFIDKSLVIAYCFGLRKDMFERLLVLYRGDFKGEHLETLEHSDGENINPYWRSKKL